LSLSVQEGQQILPGRNSWDRGVRRFRFPCQNASGIGDLVIHDIGRPHGLKARSPRSFDIRFRIVADKEDLAGVKVKLLDEFDKYGGVWFAVPEFS
jgi:hypothetical protein